MDFQSSGRWNGKNPSLNILKFFHFIESWCLQLHSKLVWWGSTLCFMLTTDMSKIIWANPIYSPLAAALSSIQLVKCSGIIVAILSLCESLGMSDCVSAHAHVYNMSFFYFIYEFRILSTKPWRKYRNFTASTSGLIKLKLEIHLLHSIYTRFGNSTTLLCKISIKDRNYKLITH